MDACAKFGMAYGVAVRHPYLRKVCTMERDVLKKLIESYTSSLETDLTQDNCLCDWVEVDTERGKKMVNSTRMGGAVNLECPVHTREGFLLAFIEMHFDIGTLTPDASFRSFRKAEHVE